VFNLSHRVLHASFFFCLGYKDDSTAVFFDFLFSELADKLGLYDHRLFGQPAFAKQLGVSRTRNVNDRDNFFVVFVLHSQLFRHQRPQLLNIDSWFVVLVAREMEMPHSDFAKVSGMVLVHVRAVMVQATSKTTTTGMLAMLANTSMACGDMAAFLAILVKASGLSRSVICTA